MDAGSVLEFNPARVGSATSGAFLWVHVELWARACGLCISQIQIHRSRISL